MACVAKACQGNEARSRAHVRRVYRPCSRVVGSGTAALGRQTNGKTAGDSWLGGP
jgi:hypothetical protein